MCAYRFCKAVTATALALIAGALIGGCATTQSITYASAEQPHSSNPVMEYKHVIITANSFAASSVLQRFYAMYPNHKYQVVAIEKVNKNHWPLLFGLGGGIVLGLLTDKGEGEGLYTGLPIGAIIGYFIGEIYRHTYVITYVERE